MMRRTHMARMERLRTAGLRLQQPKLIFLVSAAILVLIAGTIGCFFYLRHLISRPAFTAFSATVHTKTVSFPLAENNSSGGIFNSGIGVVDITLQVPCHIADAIYPDRSWPAPKLTQLHHVKLQSMKMTKDLIVRLSVLDGDAHSLRYKLSLPNPGNDAFATVALRKESHVDYPFHQSGLPSVSENAELLIIPDDHKVLEFTVKFLPDAEPASGTRKKIQPDAADFSQNRFIEKDIELADGGKMIFAENGPTEILPDTGSHLELRKRKTILETIIASDDRSKLQRGTDVIPVDDGLQFEALKDAVIHTLSFNPEKHSLDVNAGGLSEYIWVQDGLADRQLATMDWDLYASIIGVLGFIVSPVTVIYLVIHSWKGIHDARKGR